MFRERGHAGSLATKWFVHVSMILVLELSAMGVLALIGKAFPVMMCNSSVIPGSGSLPLIFSTTRRPLCNESDRLLTRLIFGSWLAQSAKAVVVMFVNGSEFDPGGAFRKDLEGVFGEGKIVYAGDLKGDLLGRPYVHEWLRRSVPLFSMSYVCWINADILLGEGWLARMYEVCESLAEQVPGARVFAAGERRDAWLEPDVDLAHGVTSRHLWGRWVGRIVRAHRWQLLGFDSADYFMMRSDALCFDLSTSLPFVLGRYAWDNWLLMMGAHVCEGVSTTVVAPCFHFDHEHANRSADASVEVNLALCPQGPCWATHADLRWVSRFEGGRAVAVLKQPRRRVIVRTPPGPHRRHKRAASGKPPRLKRRRRGR